MKIKQLMEEERPREKAFKYGVATLTNKELLALFIRSGVKGKSALDIAEAILNEVVTLHDLQAINHAKLLKIKGLTKLKLLELECVCEFARRMTKAKFEQNLAIESATILGEWLNNEIGFKNQEHFMVVFLDVKNRMITHRIIFIGTISTSIVHPREVFKEAMKYCASKIIIAHNNPSGDTTYSYADKEITKRLIEAGKICGIPVLDHVIVGKNNVFSFREHQILNFE